MCKMCKECKMFLIRYPTWPLPSSTYPNNCQHLFPKTTHVIRVAFSGGVTR